VLRTTHAGAIFKRHLDVLLHELDDGLAEVNELLEPESGSVSLVFSPSLSSWLVPDLVGSFRAKHPNVRFDLNPRRDESGQTGPGQPSIDLEITTVRPRDPTFRWRSLLVEPLWLAVPHDHPLDLCAQAGFEPHTAFEGDDLSTVRGFVAGGLGVAIVPALREGAPDVVDGPLHHVPITDAGAHREIGLAWSRDRRLLPTAQLFRRHVIQRTQSGLIPALAHSA
jgi:LysR family transcriptional activator of glutamate synthase operon